MNQVGCGAPLIRGFGVADDRPRQTSCYPQLFAILGRGEEIIYSGVISLCETGSGCRLRIRQQYQQLTKAVFERAMQAELTHHLGYENILSRAKTLATRATAMPRKLSMATS
jgi:hypothetical protein